MRISILITEANKELRAGIRDLLYLEQDFDVVAEFSTGSETLAFIRQAKHPPDVIVVDLALPDMRGVDFMRAVSEVRSGILLVGLSLFDEPVFKQKMLEAGASCVIDKQNIYHDIARELRRVCAEAAERGD